MKGNGSVFSTILIVSVLMISVPLCSQEQSSSTGYTPQIGQKGKDVVWVPTPQVLVDKMLEIAKVTPADFVIDLGSGDGRTVISAAKIGARALGVEYNPDMVELSRENAVKAGVIDHAEFINADLFDIDLSKATVITLFLLPELNLKLRPKLLDLKPGTRIVSNTFTMGDWEADYKITTEENWNSWNEAHLWIIPAKVEGKWKSGNQEINLIQKYQKVHGTITSDGKSAEISDGKLKGNLISFSAGDYRYTGQTESNKITGTATSLRDGKTTNWIAERE